MQRTSGGLPLVLASSSPRRQQLLEMIGCPFEVAPADIDEEDGGEGAPGWDDPGRRVKAIARRKVEAVAPRFPGRLVLGADTAVVVDGHPLGKPVDSREAKAMLQRLSGRWHSVYTGVALRSDREGDVLTRHVRTDVRFRALPPAWIEHYVKTGEPLDKAGAYGIQGRGSMLVSEIRGCYFTVVGLPLATLADMLEACGVSVWTKQAPTRIG